MENQPLPCSSCRQNTLPICIITTCNRSLLPHNEKLSREKTFTNLWKIRFLQRKFSQIACLSGQPNTMSPKFTEKTFTKSHKISKFKKKFSPSKVFPVYNILCLHIITCVYPLSTHDNFFREAPRVGYCCLCH